MLDIEIIPVLTDNYSYLLHDVASKQTAVVDPAEAEPVLHKLKQRGWQLDYIFNTHHHSDHVGGNLALQAATGCKIIASQSDSQRIPGIKQTVVEGDGLYLGQTLFQVIATPGHTHGHIVYYSADAQCLLSGDTLFALGCGRLFEGTATQLWQSLRKLSALPAQTRVYCAHEYTLANARFALTVEPDNQALQQRFLACQHLRREQYPTLPSTIAKELATNPFLRPLSPAIQQHLHMQGQSATEIFTRLRKMKDVF
jgi:hydroxyacylglutathione hydrolase